MPTTSGSPVLFVLDLRILSLPEPSGHVSTSSQVMAAASERLSPASRTRKHSAISTFPRSMARSLVSGRPPLDLSLGIMAVPRIAFRPSGRRAAACLWGRERADIPLRVSVTTPCRPGLSWSWNPRSRKAWTMALRASRMVVDGHSLQFQLIQVANNIDRPCRHCLETHFPAPHLKIPPVSGVSPAGVGRFDVFQVYPGGLVQPVQSEVPGRTRHHHDYRTRTRRRVCRGIWAIARTIPSIRCISTRLTVDAGCGHGSNANSRSRIS